jgi:hypothetical protein
MQNIQEERPIQRGDLILNGAHFGLCLVIIRERRSLRAWIWGVVKSEKRWFWEVVSGRLRGDFSFWWDRDKILFQGSLEIFQPGSAQNFLVKVRLKIFWAGSGREFSELGPTRPC